MNSHSVLVGNKCDLEDQRQVQTAEGEQLTEEWCKEAKYTKFFETSAKNKINLEECFYEAVRLARQQELDNKPVSRPTRLFPFFDQCQIL